jgi:uncharacterized protein YutE (UPF0331/DUF86 family)
MDIGSLRKEENMKLLLEDRERLIRYVDFMESELSDFSKFSNVNRKAYAEDKDLRRNLERWVENLVNCSIDIAKVILISEERRIPQTYKEILKELGTTEFFDEEFGESISEWAVLRNILAHEYLDVRWNSINSFIRSAEPVYKRLVTQIKSLLLP